MDLSSEVYHNTSITSCLKQFRCVGRVGCALEIQVDGADWQEGFMFTLVGWLRLYHGMYGSRLQHILYCMVPDIRFIDSMAMDLSSEIYHNTSITSCLKQLRCVLGGGVYNCKQSAGRAERAG
jgi:hypothetical protein